MTVCMSLIAFGTVGSSFSLDCLDSLGFVVQCLFE